MVAANAIESAGLLLRSGLDHGDTGRNIFDHKALRVLMRVREPVGPGKGTTIVTGASYAYYAGKHRERRAGVLLYPYNPGF